MSSESVTKEFLERFLKVPIQRYKITVEKTIDGFTCSLVQVEVWEEGSSSAPIHLLIKCFPTNPIRQHFLDASGMFPRELGIYAELIPDLIKFQDGNQLRSEVIHPPFAPFVGGNYVPPEERSGSSGCFAENCIIMKDLRRGGGFRLRDKFKGLDLDHYRLVIEAQARMHALSWAFKCRTGIEELGSMYPFLRTERLEESFKIMAKFVRANLDRAGRIVEDDCPSVLEGLDYLKKMSLSISELYYDVSGLTDEEGENRRYTKDSVLKVPGQVIEAEDAWQVLIHGDAWSNNMLFKYDSADCPVEVLFVDLQITREGDPLSDIVYCLYSSASRELRDEHLDSLLSIYFQTFTTICDDLDVPGLPGWSWKEFVRRFNRARLWGGNIAVSCMPVFLHQASPDSADLDRMAENAVKEGTDRTQKMIQYYSKISSGEVHPELKRRIVGVLEELMEHGLI